MDRDLHDLTDNDVFWDKIVEITSIGEQDVYGVCVSGRQNLMVQGISVRSSISGGETDGEFS